VTFLLDLRDRLGAMRRQPDAPSWFLTEFASLSPSLSGALATARSLLAFSRGEVQREAVGVQELLTDLKVPALSVQMGPGVESVSADPGLIRLALRALVGYARGGSAAAQPVAVRARAARAGGGRAGAPQPARAARCRRGARPAARRRGRAEPRPPHRRAARRQPDPRERRRGQPLHAQSRPGLTANPGARPCA